VLFRIKYFISVLLHYAGSVNTTLLRCAGC